MPSQQLINLVVMYQHSLLEPAVARLVHVTVEGMGADIDRRGSLEMERWLKLHVQVGFFMYRYMYIATCR